MGQNCGKWAHRWAHGWAGLWGAGDGPCCSVTEAQANAPRGHEQSEGIPRGMQGLVVPSEPDTDLGSLGEGDPSERKVESDTEAMTVAMKWLWQPRADGRDCDLSEI